MTPKLRRCLASRRRKATAGWAIIVVFLGIGIFSLIMIELSFVATSINTWITGEPSFTASYDPSTNTAVDDLLFVGLPVMVLFGAIPEIINLTQKRQSGEEVI